MADRVVIMSRGQIEQIGTPQEIYRTPRTRFVADFLGSSNIFTGKVTASDDGGVVLDTASGPLRLKSDERHVVTPGQTATLTVLDTRTNLAVTKPDGPVNAIPVRMIGEEFIGATATRDMRNAALVSAGSFVALGTLLVQRYENRGLWTAFVGYVVIRALTLLARYGAVRASVATAGPSTR